MGGGGVGEEGNCQLPAKEVGDWGWRGRRRGGSRREGGVWFKSDISGTEDIGNKQARYILQWYVFIL